MVLNPKLRWLATPHMILKLKRYLSACPSLEVQCSPQTHAPMCFFSTGICNCSPKSLSPWYVPRAQVPDGIAQATESTGLTPCRPSADTAPATRLHLSGEVGGQCGIQVPGPRAPWNSFLWVPGPGFCQPVPARWGFSWALHQVRGQEWTRKKGDPLPGLVHG